MIKRAAKQDQLITNRNNPAVVVVAKERYDQLTKKPGSLLDFFKNAPLQKIDLDLTREKDFQYNPWNVGAK